MALFKVGNNSASIKLPLPQLCDSSDSGIDKAAIQLPLMDKRKPLEKDAKDEMPDSESDQQQQQHSLLNSTSSPPCSFHRTPTKVTLPSSKQAQAPKKSFEVSSSGDPQGRGGFQGIKAARQKFLLKKAAKQQKARAASEVLQAANETSEVSSKSFTHLLNRSDASDSSSSMSSPSQKPADPKAASQPVMLPPSQSLYPQNTTSFSTTTDSPNYQYSSHGQPNSTFQYPMPQLPNEPSCLLPGMTGRNERVQNRWAIGDHLVIKVNDLPNGTTTRDLWRVFEREGHVAHIQLYENAKGVRDGGASITFRCALDSRLCSSHRKN